VNIGGDHQREDPNHAEPDNHEIGAPHAVCQAREQGGKRAGEVPECQDQHEIREGHLQLAQDERRNAAADIKLIIQRDRDRDDEKQIVPPDADRGISW
jgi:hypothetical protein